MYPVIVVQVVIFVICFPLSYKFNTGVSFVYVVKRTSGVFRIRQGQHNNRSPPDVGFAFWFRNVNVKVCRVCVSTSKWDSDMYIQRHLNTTWW